MKLTEINIVQYKNIENLAFRPHPYFNAFTGLNGMGKTNILDAVFYLCLAKSNFGRTERNNVMHDKDFFRLSGVFENEDSVDKIVIKVKPPRFKQIERNAKAIEKISDHIGYFPVVMIAPKDKTALLESSKERRKLLDRVLSQTNKKYLDAIVECNKWVKQRNALLKNSDTHSLNMNLLNTYDRKIAPLARFINITRREFISELRPVFLDFYSRISDEVPDIQYLSQLNDNDYMDLVKENIQKDIILKRSTTGIHKDDLGFTLNGYELKTNASQGQLKSYALAIKLAEFSFLKTKKGFVPLVILDDVFDKLDKIRVEKLVKLLFKKEFGQVFISDTDKSRVVKIFEDADVDYKIFEIENGNIINTESNEEKIQ